MFARPFIDSVDFARNGKEICDEIAISALPRLNDMLAQTDGSLAYTVRGYHADDGDFLEVSLRGICTLRCQRCLGELTYPIDMISRLRLLAAGSLDEVDHDDAVDAIEAESKLDVLALIEEELLLGLPFAPKHPEGKCASTLTDLQQKANPFSVLAGLKK